LEIVNDLTDVRLQSSDVITASELEPSASNDNKVGIMTFVDAEPGNVQSFEHVDDNSYTDSIRGDATLSEFLSRPVLISSQVWSLGTSLSTPLNVWSLFFNDSAIKAKLNHYAFLRCNLHIKIIINASPFYYGLFGAFYEPMQDLDPCPIVASNSDEMVVSMSQRPHVWCYVSKSQGGELCLPYLGCENWMRCSQDAEAIAQGQLTLRSVVDLQFANTGTGGPVDVEVFAWAEDVEVCGPTIAIALQSKDVKKKEYTSGSSSAPKSSKSRPKQTALKVAMEQHHCSEGTISGPSSAVARATKVAAKIASYTGHAEVGQTLSAISTAATCVSALAASYGCTDTPVIGKVQPYKSLPFHAMSSADISTPIDKLTLDPQQSLVMSGNAIGAPDADELDIESFCRRESYYKTFLWETTDVKGSVLFSAYVNPDMMRIDSTTQSPGLMLYKTPMGLAAQMFEYWRGDIVYRIRAICTDYHRGRLRVRWDPIVTTSGATTSYATNYNQVFDIQENSDIIIRIPYLQPASYSFCPSDIAEQIVDTAITDPATSRDNGCLSVSVFTEQSSPVANAPISLVVSVWGENMEFGVPSEISRNYTHYSLQSLDVIEYDETQPSTPLFEDCDTPGSLNLLYFGENITNFKQLMRRACKSTTALIAAGSSDRWTTLKLHHNRLPLYPGYDPNARYDAKGTITPGSNFPYNWCYHVPMNWIGCCFLATRGSVNWQYNVINGNNISEFSCMRSNATLSTADQVETLSVSNSTFSNVGMAETMLTDQSGITGRSLTNTATQSGLAVNAPMFSNKRYIGNSPLHRTLGNVIDNSSIDGLRTQATWCPIVGEGSNSKYIRIDSYVSIGPDYCNHFFLNVPTIFWNANIPEGADI